MGPTVEEMQVEQNGVDLDKLRDTLNLHQTSPAKVVPQRERQRKVSQYLNRPKFFERVPIVSARTLQKQEQTWSNFYEVMPSNIKEKREAILLQLTKRGVLDPHLALHRLEAWDGVSGSLYFCKNKNDFQKDQHVFGSFDELYTKIQESSQLTDFIANASQYPQAIMRMRLLGKAIFLEGLGKDEFQDQSQPILATLAQFNDIPQRNFDRTAEQLRKYPFLLPSSSMWQWNSELIQLKGLVEVFSRGGLTKKEEAILPIAKEVVALHGFRRDQHPILGELSPAQMAEGAASLQKEWLVWQQLIFEGLQRGEGRYNSTDFMDSLKRDGNAGGKIQDLIKLGVLDDLYELVRDGYSLGKNTLDLFAQRDASVYRITQHIRQALKLKDQLKNPQLQKKISFIRDLYPDQFRTSAGVLPIDIAPFLEDRNLELIEGLTELTKLLEDQPEQRRKLLASFIKPNKYSGIEVDYKAINNALTQDKLNQFPEEVKNYWETWKNIQNKKGQYVGYSSDGTAFQFFSDFLTRSWMAKTPVVREGKFTPSFYADFGHYLDALPSYLEYQVNRSSRWGPQKVSSHIKWLLDTDYVPADLKIMSDLYWENQKESQGQAANIISNNLLQTISEVQQGRFWGGLLEKLITQPNSIDAWYGEQEVRKYLDDPNVVAALDSSQQKFWLKWKDLSSDAQSVIGQNLLAMGGVNEKTAEKLEIAGAVATRLDQSSSKEIQRLKRQILGQVLQADDPLQSLEQIEAVFERNNLPAVGKIYRVFELLYSPQKVKQMLQQHWKDEKTVSYSPTLEAASTRRRFFTIYHDLLKIHVESGNPSLYGYLKTLQEGETLFDRVSQEGVDNLNYNEQHQLTRFLDNLDALYKSSRLGNKSHEQSNGRAIQDRMQMVRRNFGVAENQRLTDRVFQMFAAPLGYTSIEQTLEWMEVVRQRAHYRNINFAQEAISKGTRVNLVPGDLLKGIDDEFLDVILKNGSVAREYLGAAAASDMTPFDTDVSLVLPEDEGKSFKETVDSSLAKHYGELKILIKNRGQFIQDQSLPSSQSTYELFHTGYWGERHYGIRTGIPATEIDCMVVDGDLAKDQQELARVYFTIAQNGFYIPVVNEQGRVIFTPEDYQQYRVNSDEVRKVLDSDGYTPQTLIASLKNSPYLKILFGGQAGVSEGYSLEQHTTMVMTQFEKYFAGDWPEQLLDRSHMRTLLALHDLGKPLVFNKTGKTAEQHEYTMKFVPQILSSLNLDSKQADIILAIVDQDVLGELFQGKIDLVHASHEVSNKARSLGLSPQDLLGLLTTYYMCDASSYTSDAGGIASLDNLFVFPQPGVNDIFRLSDALQEKLEALQNSLV